MERTIYKVEIIHSEEQDFCFTISKVERRDPTDTTIVDSGSGFDARECSTAVQASLGRLLPLHES